MLTSPGRYRALTAYLLLGPATPMLFQGQEFAAASPFFYFADHKPELAKQVCKGRREFLSQFPSVAQPEMAAFLPDPSDPLTFELSKLDFSQRQTHAADYELVKDLLKLRREDPVFRTPRPRGVDGAVLGDRAFVLRFFGDDAGDRLVLVNLGRDLLPGAAPEPLLAPVEGAVWELAWSSEDPRYGGHGTPPVQASDKWRVPGEAAIVLRPADLAGEGRRR
jgi:maltooligosyltrehalose trehalohydrolase